MQVGRDDLAVSRPNWKCNYEIGKNVPRKDKIHFLINLVIDWCLILVLISFNSLYSSFGMKWYDCGILIFGRCWISKIQGNLFMAHLMPGLHGSRLSLWFHWRRLFYPLRRINNGIESFRYSLSEYSFEISFSLSYSLVSDNMIVSLIAYPVGNACV